MTPEEELQEYIKRLGILVSEYIGFSIQFSLEKSNISESVDEKEISLGLHVNDIINISGLMDEVITDVISKLIYVMQNAINKTETLDYDLFHNLTAEVSLSLIFEDYVNNNAIGKFNKINFLNDLREISSHTYESSSVDVGIVYCPNNEALKDLKKIKDIEYIKLSSAITIKEFFLNEKPFLKLIDKKSLAIAVDHNFNVFAILRKKEGSKSLYSIFENSFNEYGSNHVTKKVIASFLQPLEERQHLSSSEKEFQNFLLEKIKRNITFFENNNNAQVPKFKYIDVQNKKISFHTGNKFVISYYNGTWKLKHYNSLFAHILYRSLVTQLSHFLWLEQDEFENFIKRLSSNVSKLLHCMKNLSISSCSSIFVILDNPEISYSLSTSQVKNLLKKTALLRKVNINKNFINAIKRKSNHLNITDIDPYLLDSLSTVDGAVILDTNFNILSFGETIQVNNKDYSDTFGTGTRASRAASEYGLSIKVSEDGDINLFRDEEKLLTL